MRTRAALRRLGGQQYNLGGGPLAKLADRLVQDMQAEEAARMEEAHRRAESLGSGPQLAALQRLAREYNAEQLRNVSAPAIMRADLHDLLKAASKASSKRDNGLARAATHAYRLWSKDPSGVLTVGDVARLRDHYKAEYPRSKVAAVINEGVPKIGFNTLPVAKLTRIAADIARHASTEGADLQTVYDGVMQAQGFAQNTPECIRARAFVRGLLDDVAEPTRQELSVEERINARMATADDQLLNVEAQLDDLGMGDEDLEEMSMEEDLAAPETESAMVDSPITGEPMMLELETEDRAEDEGELGESAVDIMPGDTDRLEVMGQLEDLSGPDESIEEDRGDIPMGPMATEQSVVIADPTDPEGGQLEITMKPLEDGSSEDALEDIDDEDLGMEMEAASDKCGKCAAEECECEGEDKEAGRAFNVYAYTAGKRAEQPLETFKAAGMAQALRRIAGLGVRGEVRSTPAAFADEALIVLDAAAGDYLMVSAAVSGETDSKFHPKINEQQPAAMSGPTKDNGGESLKADSMGKGKRPKKAYAKLEQKEVMKRCASLELTPDTIEHKVLEGEMVKAAGWSLSVNDDSDLELRFDDGNARTASLVHMDDVVSDFMMHVAQHTDPETQAKQAAAKVANYGVTELFIVKCASCGGMAEYPMPEEPADAECGECGFTTTAQAIAQTFVSGDPVTGFMLVTDVPDGEDKRDRQINARRILAAIQRVLPQARGILRKDARLQIELSDANRSALKRVERVLTDTYGIKAFEIDAQVAQPAMDASGDPQAQATQGGDAGASYVGPPAQPTVQPTTPEVPQVQPAQTGTGVQQDQMQQAQQPIQASYEVHYHDEEGKVRSAPVDAATPETARTVFARFNPGIEIVRVAQMAMPPMSAPEIAPGGPMGGGEEAPLPVEPQMDGMGMGGDMGMGAPMPEEPAGDHMSQPEADAMRAALTHYRNQGLGPVAALDQLNSQYREIIDRYGEKTDHQRHMIEAEAMKIAAEVWQKPAVLEAQAAKKNAGDLPLPAVNTQQPDAVRVDKDLGKDSETDDSATSSLEAPKINTQVAPKGKMSDTSTSPDSDNNDPGDFGAGKPKAQHPATDQQGVSLSDTDMGKDSDTGECKSTKMMDSVSKKAPDATRSK